MYIFQRVSQSTCKCLRFSASASLARNFKPDVGENRKIIEWKEVQQSCLEAEYENEDVAARELFIDLIDPLDIQAYAQQNDIFDGRNDNQYEILECVASTVEDHSGRKGMSKYRNQIKTSRHEEMPVNKENFGFSSIPTTFGSSSIQLANKPNNRMKSPQDAPSLKGLLKPQNFLHLAPQHIRRRLTGLKRNWIKQQFREVLINKSEAESKEMLDKFLKSELVENADLFLEELVRHKLKKLDYGNAFSSWSKYASMERTIAGVDQLLEYILRSGKDMQSIQQNRIKMICDTIQKIFTASIAFAECVSAYIVTDKYEEAKILADYYVISPRSFVVPVKRLSEKNNIMAIERFARLFTDIYYSQINGIKPEEDEPSNNELPEYKNISFLIQSAYRRKNFKYAPKKPKIKKYEVDHRQLDILINALIDAWIDVADAKNNTQTLQNMHFFIEQNKIFIRRGHLESLTQILERNGFKENPFADFVQS